jgi:hypothetical protein
LWFASLGLSLSCALIATLVEQWTRDFIQGTEMRPSPMIRARIFSYLYFGIQRFGMHATVEFIPLLLHVSLLLFFAGLIAFLLPINPVLMILAAALLGLITATYIYLTILPIIFSDSPYRTPLSNVAWRVIQRISSLIRRRKPSRFDEESTTQDHDTSVSSKNIPTMVEVMVHDAVVDSPKRDRRDGRAIAWTLRSLTDNELEPFVDALPDLIWGPSGRRRLYDQMITKLLDGHNIQLVPRIENLLRSCDSGLLQPEQESWRRISCIKGLWAIAYFLASAVPRRESFPMFDAAFLAAQRNHSHPAVRSYSASAYWLVQWIGFCSLSSRIQQMLSLLETCAQVYDPRTILAPIQSEADARGYIGLGAELTRLISLQPDETPLVMQ